MNDRDPVASIPRVLQTSRARPLVMALLVLASVSPLTGHRSEAATLYVATSGNDAWSGRLAAPAASGTDGPLATLQGARDAVRRLKAHGGLTEPVTVVVRGGVYRVGATIELRPEDSGTEAAPITYAAATGERPVISGGRPITGWRKAEGALWKAEVPGVKEGWVFHQLFVNGLRRTRARTPNIGFLYTEGILAPIDRANWSDPNIEAKRGFRYRNGDITRWNHFEDAMIVVYHSWTTSIHFITDLDSKERVVRLAPISTWPIGYWWEYNTRYHVENVREALDQPGEWYLERATGTLLYWPLPGEDMTRAEVVAPVVGPTLLAFKGQPSTRNYVEHVAFRGLSFQHTDCLLTRDMPTDQQGATERRPMVDAVGLRHATLEDCELAHAGENGLWLDTGCSDNVVRRCHIHDLGGGAVFVGPLGAGDTPATAVERNVIDNCWIHDGSNIFRGSQGVWIGRASYNQVTHDEISDFHHLGVSVGHSWGYAPSSANHNTVAFNHVHHICNGYFSDGGGIYTLGISPGTVVRNNVVHDVVPTPLMPVGGCGIYLDEGSSGIVVENNVVSHVGAAAFTQHYGKENVVRNNVFAFGGRDPICCARPEEHLSYTFEGNIVLSSAGQATSDHYSPLKARTAFRRNLYWDLSGKPPLFSGVSFAEWQRTGRDRDSRIADPQFVDAQASDFRLQPTSPALAMGFRPIATDGVGLYGDRDWVAGPSRVKRAPLPDLPAPPPPPPPRPFVEDFESSPVGKSPRSLNLSPADRPDAIQVTDAVAASGHRCLKLTESRGLQYGFQPHVFYSSDRYTAGRVRFSCDLRNGAERPCDVYIGLRDYTVKGREYTDGPALFLREDGALVAGDKTLATVPIGKWVHLEIELETRAAARSAGEAPGTYRLVATVAGAAPRVFAALPLADPQFHQFTWFGFSGGGKPGTEFFVDNLRLELRESGK